MHIQALNKFSGDQVELRGDERIWLRGGDQVELRGGDKAENIAAR